MDTPKLMYRIPEVVEVTGISRTRIYEFMSSGELRSVNIGRTRFIRAVDLEQFIAGLYATNKLDDETAQP